MLNILMSYTPLLSFKLKWKHVFSITFENSVVADQMASSDLTPRL